MTVKKIKSTPRLLGLEGNHDINIKDSENKCNSEQCLFCCYDRYHKIADSRHFLSVVMIRVLSGYKQSFSFLKKNKSFL